MAATGTQHVEPAGAGDRSAECLRDLGLLEKR